MKRSSYSITADCVVFGYSDGELKVALIQRKNDPFKGAWALPGGFIEGNETVEEGAYRELKEETGYSVFRWLDEDELPFQEKYRFHHGDIEIDKGVDYWLAIVDGDLALEAEIVDAQWCTFEEAQTLATFDPAKAICIAAAHRLDSIAPAT